MSQQKRAYELLHAGKTFRELAEIFGVSQKQVIGWCADYCAEVNLEVAAAITATDASRYEHQTGRQKERVKAE